MLTHNKTARMLEQSGGKRNHNKPTEKRLQAPPILYHNRRGNATGKAKNERKFKNPTNGKH